MKRALSLRELERSARAIDRRCAGLVLDRVSVSGGHLMLRFEGRSLEGERVRRRLLLSCDREAAYVGEPEDGARADDATLPPFVQYLRAHLVGARLASAALRDGDRILALAFSRRAGPCTLLLQILGPRSNLYLLDADDRLEAFHRPLEDTRRELARGAPWLVPASKPPHAGDDRFAGIDEAELLRAIEREFASASAAGAHSERRRSLIIAADRELRSLAKRVDALRTDLAAIPDPEQLARQGELLKAALSRLHPGMREITMTDPADGSEVSLALDPKSSPAKNLEARFDASRRARRQRERGTLEIARLDDWIARLAAQRARLETAADDAALDALEGESPLRESRKRGRPQNRSAAESRAPTRTSPALPARLRPRRYRSRQGLEIWVGKSDASNDHLSIKLARGNDVFLHVDGGAGSHVILRTEGRPDAPGEALLEAAELAVHFSKQRGALAADVLMAPAKNVSKPRGLAPGLVHVRGGKIVRLRRDPERLERVLGQRIEDD